VPFARALALLLLLALAAVAPRPGPAGAAHLLDGRPVAEAEAVGGQGLGRFLDLLEDPGGRLGVADVAGPEAPRFAPAGADTPVPGFSRSAWWGRLTVRAREGGTWHLVYARAIVDRVSVYLPDGRGGWRELRAGQGADEAGQGMAPFPHRYAVFPVPLEPGVPTTLYVRVEDRGAVAFPLRLLAPHALHRADLTGHLLFGALFGVLATVAAYVLSIWSAMRERAHLDLVGMLLGLAFLSACQSGFVAGLPPPGASGWAGLAAEAGAVLAAVAAIGFTRRFLGTGGALPRLDAALRGAAVAVAVLLPTAAVDLRVASAAAPVAGALVAALLLAAGAAALRAGLPGARPHLLAFSVLSAGWSIRALADLGFVTSNAATENLAFVGVGVSAVALAAGVAGQFARRQEARERDLRLSNERYELAAQGAAAGLYDWDLERGAVSCSARLVELLGPAPEAAPPGEPFWSRLVHPADLARVRAEFRAFAAGGSTVLAMEYRVLSPDGVLRWVETTGAAVRDPADGRVLRLAGSTGDVTESRRAEASLRASERLKSAVIESSLDCVISTDAEGRVIEFNPAAERTFGYARAEVMGRPMAELIVPPRLRAAHEEGMRRMRALGAPRLIGRRFEIEAMRRDGSVFPVEIALVQVARGHDAVYSAFVRDVTERQRAVEALRASEARFRGIAEAHPVPVVISGIEGTVLYLSPGAERLFGAPAGEIAARPASAYYADPADRARLVAEIHERGRVDQMEVTLRRRDGAIFPASITAREIDYEGVRAILSGIQDLTERRLAEDEIARQREALHQSEKLAALGSLLAGVAHELNNPLSVVVGQSVLMEDTAADERARARAAKIRSAADRCARIVRSFLALARHRPPERAELRLDEVVESALELVFYGIRTDGIEVSLDLRRDLPRLLGDPDQLNQVVTNLLVNARQALAPAAGAAPAAGRRIAVSTGFVPAANGAEAGWVELRVADNGPGVPEAIRSRVFEPFFTTKGDGTGVGLSLCHGIVAAHGGTVAVEATPGGGATFVVRLPAAPAAAAAQSPGPRPGGAPAPARRVLVVDDEPDIALVLAEALEADGHRVDVAEDGLDALDRLAAEGSYDVVFSDLRMPRLDGPGFYRAVEREHPGLLGRIVFVTGDTLGPAVRGFLEETGAAVVEKPFSLGDVRAAVARVVEAAEGGGEGTAEGVSVDGTEAGRTPASA
jgi:PAS domain S-box-containing protein